MNPLDATCAQLQAAKIAALQKLATDAGCVSTVVSFSTAGKSHTLDFSKHVKSLREFIELVDKLCDGDVERTATAVGLVSRPSSTKTIGYFPGLM